MSAECPRDFFYPDGVVADPPYYGYWLLTNSPTSEKEIRMLLDRQAQEMFAELGFSDPTDRIEYLFNQKQVQEDATYYVSAWKVKPLPSEIASAPVK